MFNRFNGDGWSLLYCDGKLIACGSRQYIDGYVSYVTRVQDEGVLSVRQYSDPPKTLGDARKLQQSQSESDAMYVVHKVSIIDNNWVINKDMFFSKDMADRHAALENQKEDILCVQVVRVQLD